MLLGADSHLIHAVDDVHKSACVQGLTASTVALNDSIQFKEMMMMLHTTTASNTHLRTQTLEGVGHKLELSGIKSMKGVDSFL